MEGIERGLETFLQINAEMLTERHPVIHTSYNENSSPRRRKDPVLSRRRFIADALK